MNRVAFMLVDDILEELIAHFLAVSLCDGMESLCVHMQLFNVDLTGDSFGMRVMLLQIIMQF